MTRRGGGGNMRLPDLPLTSPGTCGARFLRQQEAGAPFFAWATRAGTSRSERANAETISMGAAVAHESSGSRSSVRAPRARADPAAGARSRRALHDRSLTTGPHHGAAASSSSSKSRSSSSLLSLSGASLKPQRRAPLPVALVVYTTEALLLGAARGAALTMAIATVAFVLAR